MKEQFSFTGRVIEGHHLGHTLGFPTANIVVTPGEKVPTLGVYAAWATLPDGSRHAAVTISASALPWKRQVPCGWKATFSIFPATCTGRS